MVSLGQSHACVQQSQHMLLRVGDYVNFHLFPPVLLGRVSLALLWNCPMSVNTYTQPHYSTYPNSPFPFKLVPIWGIN